MGKIKKTLAALTVTSIISSTLINRSPDSSMLAYMDEKRIETTQDTSSSFKADQQFVISSLDSALLEQYQAPTFEIDTTETAKSLRKLPKHKFYFQHKDQYLKDSLALINIVNNIDLYSEVVSKELIIALINAESNFFVSPKISHAGARGPIQVMEDGWSTVEDDPYLPNVDDPKRNIIAGVKICRWLENYCSKYNKNWERSSLQRKRDLIVAAYNCGIGTLTAYDEKKKAKSDSTYIMQRRPWYIDETPEETRNHVVKVRNTLNYILSQEEKKYLAYKQ